MTFPKSFDLLAIAIINMFMGAIVFADLQLPLFRPLMTLIMFGLLGYTALLAWAPEFTVQTLDSVLIAIALSFALPAVIGFLLHFTPWGLEPRSWTIAIIGITLTHSTVAYFRRGSLFPTIAPLETFRVTMRQGMMLLGAICIIGLSIAIARSGVFNHPGFRFTQLWMVPSGLDDVSNVQLGIRNEEAQPLSYRLVVTQGSDVVKDYASIALEHGQTWNTALSLENTGESVEALLYRSDKPNEIYRRVELK